MHTYVIYHADGEDKDNGICENLIFKNKTRRRKSRKFSRWKYKVIIIMSRRVKKFSQ